MASGWISKDVRASIYRRDRGTCAYCGCELHIGAHNSDPQAASLDHVIARSTDGALRDPKNLVAVCASCNSSKGATPLKTWCARQGRDYKACKAEVTKRIARKVR